MCLTLLSIVFMLKCGFGVLLCSCHGVMTVLSLSILQIGRGCVVRLMVCSN